MECRVWLLCVIYLLSPSVAQADIFRWVDAKGNVQFGDRPPPSSAAKRIEVEINSYESVSVEAFEAFNSGAARGKSVVMYSASWCGVGKRARQFLSQRKIPFQEYDVEKTRKGKKDFAELKGRGVPILLVRGQRMNGFSASRFERLYESRKR